MTFKEVFIESKKAHLDTGLPTNIVVTVEELEKLANEFDLDFIHINAYDPSYMSGDELVIEKNGKTKIFKLPKKKIVDAEFVISKIISMDKQDKAYVNLKQKLDKILKKINNNINIYPTSYGIGVSDIYASHQEFKNILDILDANGIQYKLKYSKALWVKQIHISKSKENLKKIETLKA